MDGFGEQFLSGTRFSGQQHRRIAPCNLQCNIEYVAHFFGGANDVFKTEGCVRKVAQIAVLVYQLPMLQCTLDSQLQFVGIHRFQYIVCGAELHCIDGVGNRAECSNKDDRRVRAGRLDSAEEVQPTDVRHTDVGNHERRRFALECLQAAVAVNCGKDCVSFFLQPELDKAPLAGVVINDKDKCIRHSQMLRDAESTTPVSNTGMVTENVIPR